MRSGQLRRSMQVRLGQQAMQQHQHAFALPIAGQFEGGLAPSNRQPGIHNPLQYALAVRLYLQRQFRHATYDSPAHDQNP